MGGEKIRSRVSERVGAGSPAEDVISLTSLAIKRREKPCMSRCLSGIGLRPGRLPLGSRRRGGWGRGLPPSKIILPVRENFDGLCQGLGWVSRAACVGAGGAHFTRSDIGSPVTSGPTQYLASPTISSLSPAGPFSQRGGPDPSPQEFRTRIAATMPARVPL